MIEIQRSFQPEPARGDNWKRKAALFLASQTFSLFGSMLVSYAIIWHVTLTTQSGAMLTVAMLSGLLPQIVISLFAGVWADRYNRKRLIILADLLTAASTLALAVLFMLGYRELWLLFLISGIRSVGSGVQMPAVNALLPQIVPADRLVKVNGINSTLNPFVMLLSPIAAGALLSLARLESIFFVDVVTAAAAVSLLLALKVPPHHKAAEAQTAGYFDDLKAGLGYVRGHRAVRSLFAFYAAVFLLIAPVGFLTPLLVTRKFGEEVWRLTANEVTFFVGMILGGMLMTAWGGFKNHFRTIGLGCIIASAMWAGLGTTGLFPVYLGFMFLSGIPVALINVGSTSLLQQMVEPDMQGRVFGVSQLIQNAVMPVGMAVFGPLGDVMSIEVLLIATGLVMMLPGFWLFLRNRPATEAPAGATAPAHAAAYDSDCAAAPEGCA